MKTQKKNDVKKVSLESIKFAEGVQIRVQLDSETIEDYSHAMLGRAEFPAIVVFQAKPSAEYILADGFHRVEAARKAGLSEILAEVRQGDRRAATTYALGANSLHGRRRTNADKRRSVEIALREFNEYSDRHLAELCCVTDGMVRAVRDQVQDLRTSLPTQRVGKDGKAYPTKPRSLVKKPSTKDKEIQVIRMPASACDIPAASDKNIAWENPGDQQTMTTFQKLIEITATNRPGSIPFLRFRIATIGNWLDGLDAIPKPQISVATKEHTLPSQAIT